MLNKDFNERCSAKEAFNHNWIQNNTNNGELDKKCLDNLSNFYVNKFKIILLKLKI